MSASQSFQTLLGNSVLSMSGIWVQWNFGTYARDWAASGLGFSLAAILLSLVVSATLSLWKVKPGKQRMIN